MVKFVCLNYFYVFNSLSINLIITFWRILQWSRIKTKVQFILCNISNAKSFHSVLHQKFKNISLRNFYWIKSQVISFNLVKNVFEKKYNRIMLFTKILNYRNFRNWNKQRDVLFIGIRLTLNQFLYNDSLRFQSHLSSRWSDSHEYRFIETTIKVKWSSIVLFSVFFTLLRWYICR